MRKLLLALALAVALLGIAACGGDDTTAGGDSTAAGAECTKASLATKTAGTLTLGTDNPAFPPWFGGGEKDKPWEINDPSTGEGYESAVAYAVAQKLGFATTEVKWAVTKFTDGTPEQFGMVLEKGSGLTACVSTVVDGLRADGTLEKLEQQFLAGAAAPFLK